MKANAAKSVPLAGAVFVDGAASFIHKGTNGRWRDALIAEDCGRYERAAAAT